MYRKYLTVQPWSEYFSTSQPFPSTVVAWIQLLGIPGFMYRRNVIKIIGELIRRVIELNSNIGRAQREHYVRMAILLDLNKPIISKIKIDGRVRRVEYESLPNVSFACGYYGHMRENCATQVEHNRAMEVGGVISSVVKGVLHLVRRLVPRQGLINRLRWRRLVSHWNSKLVQKPTIKTGEKEKVDFKGSCFNALHKFGNKDFVANLTKSTDLKGKGVAIYDNPPGVDEGSVT